METFRSFLKGPYTTVKMDLDDPSWSRDAKVPSKPGWYFISTTTPMDVLLRQELWQHQYIKKRSELAAPVKNYDLAARCRRRTETLAAFWNTEHVYSGLAGNLRTRAREHTLPDPGTGALAISRYPELKPYNWHFSYLTLEQFMPNCPDPNVLLLLGEQVWRAENGWPVLCAE